MTVSELILLGLVVAAAVAAGYFIGRWSADRDLGARSARPSPLPAPDDLPGDTPDEPAAPRVPSRPRGTPPPASAGGDYGSAEPAPSSRTRSAPPPVSAGGHPSDGASGGDGSPQPRPRRGTPPPAAAGVMGPGDTGRKR